jgi:UDP-N-acetyl-D-mannosaminuronic acid dehydrogenase
MNNKKICIIGLGYIGLPTAAFLASKGYYVNGVDIDTSIIKTVNDGKIHIVENGLESLVKSAVSKNKLKANSKPEISDIYIICVPTPFHKGGAIPDPNIDIVLEATRSIAQLLKPNDTVILESTSPVGTTEKVASELEKCGVDISNINIAYCPERVLPGNILLELESNDRIVGGINERSTKAASKFYRSIVSGNVLETTAKTAEMCKLTENSFRDVNIAFANELSVLCQNDNIDVWELISLANHHPRVNILQPGVGVGGHCIAVDPWFIVSRHKHLSKIIKTAREVNLFKTEWVEKEIEKEIHKYKNNSPKVALFGVAFKPNIDDLRESPALEIANNISKKYKDTVIVEPNINNSSNFNIVSILDALEEADICIFLVKHNEFKEIKFENFKNDVKVLDFCGVFR